MAGLQDGKMEAWLKNHLQELSDMSLKRVPTLINVLITVSQFMCDLVI